MAEIGDSTSLRREDINDFPPQTIKLILAQQSKGWRAVRSNRNHVMLLAPDGESRYSASRNSNSWKFLKEDIARYERDHPVTATVKTVEVERVLCPRPDCVRAFGSLDQLNAHIQVDHENMVRCPDCVATFPDLRRMTVHRSRVHGYESPRKQARLAAEAKRKRKQHAAPTGTTVAEVIATPFNDWIKDFEAQRAAAFSVEILDHAAVLEFPAPATLGSGIQGATPVVRYVQKKEPVVADTPVEFIDERNSWTLDLNKIGASTIAGLGEQMAVAGLKLEVRVWRDS